MKGAPFKVLAVVRAQEGYDGLQKALRARWLALGIRGEDLDDMAFLTAGHGPKMLSPDPPKNLGATTLGPVLGALGAMLLVVVDEEALARIRKHLGKRSVRPENAGMSMQAKRKRKRRAKSPFRLSPDFARLCRARQLLGQTERQRSIIARKAARGRWGKVRATKPYVGITGRAPA